GVHHEHDVQATVAKIFRNRRCNQRAFHPDKRWLVRRCDDNNRASKTFRSKVLLDKLEHLPTTFTHHSNHIHISRSVASNHSEQSTLADTRSCEYTNTLALADGQQTIDGTNSNSERHLHARTHERIAWCIICRAV